MFSVMQELMSQVPGCVRTVLLFQTHRPQHLPQISITEMSPGLRPSKFKWTLRSDHKTPENLWIQICKNRLHMTLWEEANPHLNR